MWNLKKKLEQTILFTKQKQRQRRRKQMYGYQGRKGVWNELGDWDWHVYTIDTMYKINRQ